MNLLVSDTVDESDVGNKSSVQYPTLTSHDKIQGTIGAILEVAVSSIPFGGPLAIGLLGIRQRKAVEIVVNFVSEFAKFLSDNEEKIDIEYIHSNDFSDLFASVIERVSRLRSEDKIHRFQRILRKGVLNKIYPEDNTDVYLTLINDLTETEIAILEGHKGFSTFFKDSHKYIRDLKVESKELENHNIAKSKTIGQTHSNTTIRGTDPKILIERRIDLIKMHHYREAKDYSLTESTYLYHKHSLISKGLFTDIGSNLGLDTYRYVAITEFGEGFLGFIKEY